MNLDDHPILLTYLVGSAAAIAATLVVSVETYAISWLFKGNILRKNLGKLQNPANNKFWWNAAGYCVALMANALFSWLAVLFTAFQFIRAPLLAIREAFVSVPEEVKRLKYPLMTNPELSRESTWAYLSAWNAKLGQPNSATGLDDELYDLSRWYPSFYSQKALNVLRSLNALDPQVLEDVAILVKERERKQEPFTPVANKFGDTPMLSMTDS